MSRHIVAKWIRDILPKKCMNCGSTTGLTYHHIVPHELGGLDVPSNIAVLCTKCHAKIHYGKSGVIDHGDLVRKGIAKAKEKGVRLGRKGIDHERVMRLIAENSTQFNPESMMTEHEIMEMAGVKWTCYCQCKRELYEEMAKDDWPYEWDKPRKFLNMPIYEHKIVRIREQRNYEEEERRMNKTIMIGNLANDPETRTAKSGNQVCTFRLAVQRRMPNAQGVREADFFNVVTFRRTAEFCGKYLSKGNRVVVEGSIQNRQYDAQDGSKRWVTEVLADNVESLSPRPDPADRPQESAQAAPQQGFTDVTAEEEDELPF